MQSCHIAQSDPAQTYQFIELGRKNGRRKSGLAAILAGLLPLELQSICQCIGLMCHSKRRIKCDESKPVCKKCLLHALPCESFGYAALPRSRRVPQLNPQPVYFLAPSGVDPTPQERQMFDMLCTRVTEVAGGYDVSFWAVDVLQAATQSHPAVWHASLAFSAMHQRMKVIHRQEHDSFARSYYITGIRQYNASISYLITLMQKKNPSYLEKQAVILTSLMQYALCCVQRNLKSARIHGLKALKLFYEWKLWDIPPDCRGILNPMGLMRQVALCFDDMDAIEDDVVPQDLPRHLFYGEESSSKAFNSAADAFFAYLAIRLGTFDGDLGDVKTPVQHPLLTRQMRRAWAKAAWRKRFQLLQKSQLVQHEDLNVMNYLLLQAKWDALHKDWIGPESPGNRQKLIPKILQLMDEAEGELFRQTAKAQRGGSKFTATAPLEPLFSYSLGPMNVIQRIGNLTYCLPFRQRAIQILRKYPLTEGLWSNRLACARLEFSNLYRSQGGFDDVHSTCGCDPITVKPCNDHRLATFDFDVDDEGFVTFTARSWYDLRHGLLGLTRTYAPE